MNQSTENTLCPITNLELIQSLVCKTLPESTYTGGTAVGQQNKKINPLLSEKATHGHNVTNEFSLNIV